MQKETSYSEAINTKYPEQVVIAIAKEADGKYNPITLGWCMCTSIKPPMLAISVGKTRHSLEVIRQAGAFVVSFPSEEQTDESLFYGTKSGRDLDKIKEFGGQTEAGKQVDCVILTDAVANFECKLAGELDTGDHVIFAGEVVASYINTEEKIRVYQAAGGYVMKGIAQEKKK
jgi:flavin reductase (DIM6/NTAB) family NADH-FMN oxidoreductase RutF